MAQKNRSIFKYYTLKKRGETWHAYFSSKATGLLPVRESTRSCDEYEAHEYCLRRLEDFKNKKNNEITLEEACGKYYLEFGRNLKTADDLWSKTQNLLKYLDGKKLLSEITKSDISQFINEKINVESKTPATVNRYLSLLSVIFNTARDIWDLNTPNINLRLFKKREPSENIKYFKNWEEIKKIIDAAADHLKPIIYTAIYTGLRRGNILGLKWSNIDFVNNMIIILSKNSKTAKGKVHSIPMSKELRDILESQPKFNEYVFNYNCKPILDIKKSWKSAVEKAGITYISFHSIRHTITTWMIRDGIDARSIQDFMGWSNLNMINRYGHLSLDNKQKVLEKIQFKK